MSIVNDDFIKLTKDELEEQIKVCTALDDLKNELKHVSKFQKFKIKLDGKEVICNNHLETITGRVIFLPIERGEIIDINYDNILNLEFLGVVE